MAADVLIVGAGPAGLALAVDLARRGVRAVVVERRPDGLFPGSRGKGIQPRTLEVFDDLGIVDAVLKAGGPAPVGMAWDAAGTRLGEHDLFERAAPAPGAPYGEPWMLPQWRTQEILYDRLTELGGEVRFGAALTALDQDASAVTAELSDGSRVTAAYAVAADGGRSTVRTLLGVGMTAVPGAPEPVPSLVADVRIPALDRLNWHFFIQAAEGFLTLCPLPGTGLFLVRPDGYVGWVGGVEDAGWVEYPGW